MSSSVRETPADFDVKLELSTELLDDSHRLILWLAAFAAWVSVLDLCFRTQRYDWPSVTSALLVGGVASSAVMRRRHPGLARSILTVALAAAYLTAILTRPHGSLRYFGTLILLACSSLLPVASYVLLTAALCAGLALLELLAPSASIGWPAVREAALLMVLTAALTTLSRRHLILALSWAN